jgi:hypothetical protein
VELEVLVPVGSDGVCAKLHASKTPFAERDRAAFERLMASVRFDPAAARLERAFLIPGRGTLLITVPAAWGFRTGKPAAGTPRNVTFMEPEGDNQLMATLLPDAEQVLKGDPTTRTFVDIGRTAAKPKAVGGQARPAKRLETPAARRAAPRAVAAFLLAVLQREGKPGRGRRAASHPRGSTRPSAVSGIPD